MKEASGELNMTVITVVAIAAIGALLWGLWGPIQTTLNNAFGAGGIDCGPGVAAKVDASGNLYCPD